MNKKVIEKVKSRCNICNKIYASKSSLCNHIKNIHNADKNILTSDNIQITSDNIQITSQ